MLRAQVVKRDGFLEHLLCLRNTKEHEAILATDAVPRLIHAGLILTGADPGHPVRYRPEFQPAEGPPIAVTVEWIEDGKTRTGRRPDLGPGGRVGQAAGRSAGSSPAACEIERPGLDQPLYAADGGDLITVSNFPEAILDLPIASTADDAALNYVANTPLIPPLGTFVTLHLAPARDAEPAGDPEPAKAAAAPPTTP